MPKKKTWKHDQFLRKTKGYPLWKNVNFSSFSTSCFYCLEKSFFVLEYHKKHFPGLYYLKKKHRKIANFWAKPWVNPFGKMSIFWTFSTSCFYCLERRFFVLEYHKTPFSGPYCPKIRDGKMANFWGKPNVNTFGKMSIFRLFQLLVFIA